MAFFLNLFGVVAFGWFLYKLGVLFEQILRSPKNLKKYGEWSIITGATSGIGKAIAFELAKRGQHVLLIARNNDKLIKTQNDIKSSNSGINVEILKIDLSNMTKDNENEFKNFIKTHNVGVLVNNAGLSYNYTRYFDEIKQDRLESMINVNNKSPSILTYLFVKELIKRDTKDKGCVINISSAGAVIPHQLHSVYSATKSFLNKITLDLALEYTDKGIMFQVQLPYFVVSNMSKIKKPTLTTPSAADFAKASVNQFGYPGLCFPYPIHAVIFFVLGFIPNYILEKVVGSIHKTTMSKGNYVYQETFGFIKPDASAKADEIMAEIKENGFEIIEYKKFKLSKEKAEAFYGEHKERGFFGDLVKYMTSGDVVALRLQKKNAIKEWRELMGPTDAAKAKKEAPNSLRAKYGTNIEANACHGSDSPKAAKRELNLIFDD